MARIVLPKALTTMQLSRDQIVALAPDAQVASAGGKLSTARHWKNTGRSEAAVWGECQGSALYSVQVDLGGPAFRCSCPSRKIPCKHVIGLLLLAAEGPIESAEPPESIVAWLQQRAARATASETRTARPARSTPTPKKHDREQEKLDRVRRGVEALERWMEDLVRAGVAGAELQPISFWERAAGRLVDDGAPGLASRVRALAGIPRSSDNWPRHLLEEMGKLALLCRAIHRFEALEEPLQHDIRRLIGWTLKAEEVAALGEAMRDDWAIVGQWVEDQDALRAQRTWLVGLSKGQHALILQFAHRTQPSFPWVGTPGTRQEMTLHFWPGSLKQRARIAERYGAPLPFAGPLPEETSIAGFLEAEARRLALLPWHDVSLCLLSDVVPVRRKGGHWIIQDAAYHALPMVDSVRWQPPQWRLLAFSGGHPVQFVGEWGGSLVRPLGAFAESRFQEIGPRLSDQRLIDGSGRMDFYAGA